MSALGGCAWSGGCLLLGGSAPGGVEFLLQGCVPANERTQDTIHVSTHTCIESSVMVHLHWLLY